MSVGEVLPEPVDDRLPWEDESLYCEGDLDVDDEDDWVETMCAVPAPEES